MIILHWLMFSTGHITHWAYSNPKGGDGIPYFVGMAIIIGIGMIIAGLAMDSSTDIWWWLRVWSGFIVAGVVWPQVVIGLLWVVTAAMLFGLPVLLIVAWWKLIPSKEQRIQKRQEKVASIQAAISEEQEVF